MHCRVTWDEDERSVRWVKQAQPKDALGFGKGDASFGV